MAVALSDVDDVLSRVRREDEERLLAAADAETLPLPDGVEVGAVVFADLLAVAHGEVPRFGQLGQPLVRGLFALVYGSRVAPELGPRGEDLVDVAALRGEFLLEEYRQIDLPDEADALRVLALGRGQPLFGGDAPHFGLEQSAHGEEGAAQLLLRELAEEVALVLVRVAPGQQTVDDAAVRLHGLLLAAVVPRGDVVGPELQRLAQEDVELDLAVAQHVGVGRAAPFILGEHVIDHPCAVLLRKIDRVQRDVEPLGHQLGEEPVVVPRTVALKRPRGVVPVDHEKPDDLVPLLLEEPCGDRRIDAARKSDYYTCHLSVAVALFSFIRGPADPRAARDGSASPRSRCGR